MGDRFYTQQLQSLGDCPGNKTPNKRIRKVAWTDESKAQAVSMYEAGEPTPELFFRVKSNSSDSC